MSDACVFSCLLTIFLRHALAGTPIWFGLGGLGLTDDVLQAVANKVVSASLLVPVVLTILIPPKVVRRNMLFVMASLVTRVGPLVGISFASYEVRTMQYHIVSCRIVYYSIQ
jgi:hypothetical protein